MKLSLTLGDLLVNAEHNKFTGKVLIESQNSVQWQLYFLLGKLIWINGGYHSNRSWFRILIKFCPEINCEDLGSATKSYYECPQYQTLYLLASKKIISNDKVKLILETRIQEKFFDIIQEHKKWDVSYTLKQDSPSNILNYGFKPSLAIIDYHAILKNIEQDKTFSQESIFKNISLNHAPKVIDSQKLQQKVNLDTYSHLIHFFDGKLSLRDLALRLNKNVIKLALSLTSYLTESIVEFVEIPDVNNNITLKKYRLKCLKYHRSKAKFSVACIHNNQQINQIIDQVVTRSRGRFLAIEDEFQAITSLIEYNPDLILINVAMPVVNGYELCSQIKRVAKFNQTPIIMLSEGKSITDRMRTKLVGASDFITNPLDESKITKTLKKYTSNFTKSEQQTRPVLAFT